MLGAFLFGLFVGGMGVFAFMSLRNPAKWG